jgi:hypothetical protein
MHFWPNKSLTRASKLYNVKSQLANRPKNIADETWTEIVKETKLNKLIVLDAVPKVSQKQASTKNNKFGGTKNGDV